MRIIRTIVAMSAALAILVSCQEQDIESPVSGEDLVPVSLTGTFEVGETKATYTETNTDGIKLYPAWEEDDNVIGFDGENNTYTFVVSEVDGTTGKATLTGEAPANCTLHLIYLYGTDVSAITDGSLFVSYDAQKGDKTMPAVMLADGAVIYGTGNFEFHNAGAVIGISAVKGVPQDAVVSTITIEGANLSAATIALEGSSLKLTAKENANDAISTATLTGVTVTDTEGTLSSTNPILIAVPAGAEVSKVSVTTDNGPFAFTLASTATLSANQYTYVKDQAFEKTPEYVEIAGLKWATENLAITESGKREYNHTGHVNGDYFQWGAYAGYCGNASDADKGLLVYNAFSSTMCGDDSDSFTFKGSYQFNIASAPYHSSSSAYDGKYKTSALTKLELGDDVVNIILGGNWRMPTKAEFSSLISATYWQWDAKDKGYYAYEPNPASDAGKKDDDGNGSYSKDDALLFFPASGVCSGVNLFSAGNSGSYRSSSLDTNDDAHYFATMSSGTLKMNSAQRCYGYTIRPVSE